MADQDMPQIILSEDGSDIAVRVPMEKAEQHFVSETKEVRQQLHEEKKGKAQRIGTVKSGKFVIPEGADFLVKAETTSEVFSEAFGVPVKLNPKGQAVKKSLKPSDVDREQLIMGIETELEHTDDKAEAAGTSLDHLAEDKAYYTKLREVEGAEKSMVIGPNGAILVKAAATAGKVAKQIDVKKKGGGTYKQTRMMSPEDAAKLDAGQGQQPQGQQQQGAAQPQGVISPELADRLRQELGQNGGAAQQNGQAPQNGQAQPPQNGEQSGQEPAAEQKKSAVGNFVAKLAQSIMDKLGMQFRGGDVTAATVAEARGKVQQLGSGGKLEEEGDRKKKAQEQGSAEGGKGAGGKNGKAGAANGKGGSAEAAETGATPAPETVAKDKDREPENPQQKEKRAAEEMQAQASRTKEDLGQKQVGQGPEPEKKKRKRLTNLFEKIAKDRGGRGKKD